MWSKNNKERHYKRTYTWKKENKDVCNELSKAWRKANPEKAKTSVANWNKLNRDKVTLYIAKRRATKRNATPSWLTQEQLNQIANMYWLAKDLEAVSGQKYHVDHIIPLQGDGVCGLHVPWNLQILPSDMNIAKSNKYTA